MNCFLLQLLGAVGLLVTLPLAAQSIPTKQAIRVTLQSEKNTYRVGEDIRLALCLENISRQAYYVGSDINSVYVLSYLHGIQLLMKDSEGRKITWAMAAADPVLPTGSRLTKTNVAKEYLLLKPQSIYGFRVSLQARTFVTKLQPGRYRLSATYVEHWLNHLTEAEAKSLDAPIWTEEIKSNPIEITIIR